MNKPDDFDCWRLPDDESVPKVMITPDTKVQNAVTMVVEREDHTLGNMLRMQLLEDRDVLFSGYRVPHPLEPAIQVKVQTGSEIPGPTQAVEAALGSLLGELKTFEERFRAELLNRGGRITTTQNSSASTGSGLEAMLT